MFSTFSSSLFTKYSLFISFLFMAGGYTMNTGNICNDLHEAEHLCLVYSLGVTNITSQDIIDKFTRLQPTDETAENMANLCSPYHACTLEFTKCILPAFKEIKCENNPTLIRMCRNFNIQVKHDENDNKFVCV